MPACDGFSTPDSGGDLHLSLHKVTGEVGDGDREPFVPCCHVCALPDKGAGSGWCTWSASAEADIVVAVFAGVKKLCVGDELAAEDSGLHSSSAHPLPNNFGERAGTPETPPSPYCTGELVSGDRPARCRRGIALKLADCDPADAGLCAHALLAADESGLHASSAHADTVGDILSFSARGPGRCCAV